MTMETHAASMAADLVRAGRRLARARSSDLVDAENAGHDDAGMATFIMTAGQCRAGRALIAMTQQQLADAAGVGLSSVVDLEKSRRAVSVEMTVKIRRALERSGIEIIPGGVRLNPTREG